LIETRTGARFDAPQYTWLSAYDPRRKIGGRVKTTAGNHSRKDRSLDNAEAFREENRGSP